MWAILPNGCCAAPTERRRLDAGRHRCGDRERARQDIRLEKPVPVAWVYLTGYATADGAVHFREDVYGLDAPKSDVVPEPQMVDVPATASIKPKRL